MLVGVLISLLAGSGLALAGSGLALAGSATGCRINPDSDDDWPAWPPILTDQLGDLILPNQVHFSKNGLFQLFTMYQAACFAQPMPKPSLGLPYSGSELPLQSVSNPGQLKLVMTVHFQAQLVLKLNIMKVEERREILLAPGQVVALTCGAGGQFEGEAGWEAGPVWAECGDPDQQAVLMVAGEPWQFRELGCRHQPSDSNQEVGQPYCQLTINIIIQFRL